MSVQVTRRGKGAVIAVGRVFSGREAEQVRSVIRDIAAGETVEIDFSGTAEIHPVALGALVELAGAEQVTLRTRGLGVAHRRLLEYLGSGARAQGNGA